jgi:hypothetical protein
MRSFTLQIDEKYFNLLWRSVVARENELLNKLSKEDEESDEAALISNDIVYLRLTKKDLKEKAGKAGFSRGSFSLNDGFVDLADL